MKRLAIFTEGQTEQLFLERLLLEIANKADIVIESRKSALSPKGLRVFKELRYTSNNQNQNFYVLICDSSSDSCVQSDIIDQYANLSKKDYFMILGLRDVYPLEYSDIPKLQRSLKLKVPTSPVPTSIFLAVMEIETWFLAETSHLIKVSPMLTTEFIKRSLGLDLENDDLENIHHPAEQLDNIYKLAGKSYKKHKSRTEEILNHLDYGEIYLNVRHKISGLDQFLSCLDSFFSN